MERFNCENRDPPLNPPICTVPAATFSAPVNTSCAFNCNTPPPFFVMPPPEPITPCSTSPAVVGAKSVNVLKSYVFTVTVEARTPKSRRPTTVATATGFTGVEEMPPPPSVSVPVPSGERLRKVVTVGDVPPPPESLKTSPASVLLPTSESAPRPFTVTVFAELITPPTSWKIAPTPDTSPPPIVMPPAGMFPPAPTTRFPPFTTVPPV